MKRMKKMLIFTLICMALLSVALPVFADVILEPNNDFYHEHQHECIYNNYRQYIVNTDKGHAYLYVSPDSVRTIKGVSNGDQVFITWLYTDPDTQEEWGLLYNHSGWFRMSDLTVVYDQYSFLEDHQGQMREYVAGTYQIEVSQSKPAPMWTYPGKLMEQSFFYDGEITKFVSETYTDAEGTVWGYISNYRGQRHVWICLTDPYGTGIHADDTSSEATGSDTHPSTADSDADTQDTNAHIELKADPTPSDEIPMSEGNKQMLVTVGLLIGGVLLLTATVIVILFVVKKKKSSFVE